MGENAGWLGSAACGRGAGGGVGLGLGVGLGTGGAGAVSASGSGSASKVIISTEIVSGSGSTRSGIMKLGFMMKKNPI